MASTKSPVNNRTTESVDYLSALPPEIQHLVFDHLFPVHEPDIAFETHSAARKLVGVPHPLDHVAASCRQLRQSVNAWAQHWLKAHAKITGYKDIKTNKARAKRAYLRGKGGLLTWAEKHCVFCGKASARSAIFISGLRCCMRCDKAQWPDKITKTAAKEKFDLRDHHLLPGRHEQASSLPKHDIVFPKLRYGTYFSSNVATTMFLTKDVQRLAQVVHGNVQTHMERRKAQSEARKAAKARKAEQKRRMDLEWMSKNAPFQYAKETGQSNTNAGAELQSLMAQTGVNVQMLNPGLLRRVLQEW
jgi:hypothetical protein